MILRQILCRRNHPRIQQNCQKGNFRTLQQFHTFRNNNNNTASKVFLLNQNKNGSPHHSQQGKNNNNLYNVPQTKIIIEQEQQQNCNYNPLLLLHQKYTISNNNNYNTNYQFLQNNKWLSLISPWNGSSPTAHYYHPTTTKQHRWFQKRRQSLQQHYYQLSKKLNNHSLQSCRSFGDSTKPPSGNNNNNNNNKESSSTETTSSPPTITFIAAANETRYNKLKRITEELDLGDFLSISTILALSSFIVIKLFMAPQMRQSDMMYDFLSTDDSILDMDNILQNVISTLNDEDDEETKVDENGNIIKKSAVDFMLADLLSSNALQQAAMKFVIDIITSKEVKDTLQLLLKELFHDLIQDPETIAQVIHLLQVAIEHEDIRNATQKLVIDLVNDEEVYNELMKLLQNLGNHKDVLNSMQSLLSEAAHNALNDPEILDHSMEFATDVVGDDIVQQTAGEALRNTVSYAFFFNQGDGGGSSNSGGRGFVSSSSEYLPFIMIVGTTAIGVGLLFFSIMSYGYASSSEHDAELLNQVVSRTLPLLSTNKLYETLLSFLSYPSYLVTTVFTKMIHYMQYPFVLLSSTSRDVLKATSNIISIPYATLLSILQKFTRNIMKGMTAAITLPYNTISSLYQNVISNTIQITSTAMALPYNKILMACQNLLNKSSTIVSAIVDTSSWFSWQVHVLNHLTIPKIVFLVEQRKRNILSTLKSIYLLVLANTTAIKSMFLPFYSIGSSSKDDSTIRSSIGNSLSNGSSRLQKFFSENEKIAKVSERLIQLLDDAVTRFKWEYYVLIKRYTS